MKYSARSSPLQMANQHGRSPTHATGVIRLNYLTQRRPRHERVHRRQKLIAPRLPAVALKARLKIASHRQSLLLHSPTTHHAHLRGSFSANPELIWLEAVKDESQRITRVRLRGTCDSHCQGSARQRSTGVGTALRLHRLVDIDALFDRAFHVGTQRLQAGLCLCPRRSQVGHPAVARNDALRCPLLQGRESLQPGHGAADRQHGQQPAGSLTAPRHEANSCR